MISTMLYLSPHPTPPLDIIAGPVKMKWRTLYHLGEVPSYNGGGARHLFSLVPINDDAFFQTQEHDILLYVFFPDWGTLF